MAIKGKTILLGSAFCKQAERKVERGEIMSREVQKMKREARRGDGGDKGGRISYFVHCREIYF